MIPTPAQIKAARTAAGMTQPEAAAVVHRTNYKRWSEWENGHKAMPAAEWELFCLKTKYKVIDTADNKQ